MSDTDIPKEQSSMPVESPSRPPTVPTTPAQPTTTESAGESSPRGQNTDPEPSSSTTPSQPSTSAPLALPVGHGTVDPSNFETKHPLNSRWTLWYDSPGRHTLTSWSERLKKVHVFDTVEDFWRLWNHITPPPSLPPGSTYHLFREDIRPEWEDKYNAAGGKWTVSWPRNKRQKLDQYWLNLVLEIIGESMAGCEEINGAVVCVRKAQDRIAVWTRQTDANESVKQLGEGIKRALYPDGVGTVNPEFAAHSDSLRHAQTSAQRTR